MRPAVANQCHGPVPLLYEMHQTLNTMKHFFLRSLHYQLKVLLYYCDTMGPQRVAHVQINCISVTQKKRHFLSMAAHQGSQNVIPHRE